MTKMTQKEAVFQAVKNVCGEQEGAYTPSKEQRAQVKHLDHFQNHNQTYQYR